MDEESVLAYLRAVGGRSPDLPGVRPGSAPLRRGPGPGPDPSAVQPARRRDTQPAGVRPAAAHPTGQQARDGVLARPAAGTGRYALPDLWRQRKGRGRGRTSWPSRQPCWCLDHRRRDGIRAAPNRLPPWIEIPRRPPKGSCSLSAAGLRKNGSPTTRLFPATKTRCTWTRSLPLAPSSAASSLTAC